MTAKAKRRIYIAGPMTGLPGLNYAAFDAAAARLRKTFDVCNPADTGRRYGNPGTEALAYGRMIREEVLALRSCNAIYLLPGWERSEGARRELRIALEHGLDIYLDQGASGTSEEGVAR